jgi:hypothetical protein
MSKTGDLVIGELTQWLQQTEVYSDCTVMPKEYYNRLVFWAYHLIDLGIKEKKTGDLTADEAETLMNMFNDEYKKSIKMKE